MISDRSASSEDEDDDEDDKNAISKNKLRDTKEGIFRVLFFGLYICILCFDTVSPSNYQCQTLLLSHAGWTEQKKTCRVTPVPN